MITDVPSVSVDVHHRYSPEIRDRIIAKLRSAMEASDDAAYRLLSPAYLRRLAAFASPQAPVVSLYLQLGPGRRVGNAWHAAFSGLTHSALRHVDGRRERHELKDELDRIESALQQELPALGLGAAFFACRPMGFWRRIAVSVMLPDAVHVGRRPYIRPLVRTRDEHDRFVLALLSQERSRFFISQIGQVEEVIRVEGQSPAEILADRAATSRRDQIVAEALKNEAKVLAQVAERALAEFEGRYLLLSSAPELRRAVIQYLPKDVVRDRLGGEFAAELHAEPHAVADAARPAQRSIEERAELATIERLNEAGPARSAWGAPRTLEALREGRVMLLAVEEALGGSGTRCTACAGLWEFTPLRCPACDGEVVEVEDVVELALEQALQQNAAIEIVRSARARQLIADRGGMAALLRW